MAKTIVELMQSPANDALNRELEIDMGKAETCYTAAMKDLDEQEGLFKCGMEQAMQKYRWTLRLGWFSLIFLGPIGLHFACSAFVVKDWDLAMLVVSTCCLLAWCLPSPSATKHQILAKQFGESKQGIARCKVLWKGVFMAVRRVQAQLDEFKGIGNDRLHRQRDALV
eukprot:175632-Amphidinium_carterae.1